MPWAPPRWLRPLLFVVCLIPAAWVAFAIASDFFNGTRLLGSNPIKEAEHFTGRWVLRFLAITLAVTPIRQTLGWNWLQRHRRMFGLFAFAYATLHLSIYFFLDLELAWGDLWADIVKRPYGGVRAARSARRDVDRENGEAARRQAVGRAPPADLRDRRAGDHSLLDGREA